MIKNNRLYHIISTKVVKIDDISSTNSINLVRRQQQIRIGYMCLIVVFWFGSIA